MIAIHDISHNDLARLNEPLALLARAYHFKEWADAAAAATLIERVAGDVLQYAEDDADELAQIARATNAAERLRDRARLGRVLEHLARLVGRWPLDELGAAEADLFLGLQPGGVRQAVWAGRLAAVKKGNSWFVKLDNLLTYAQARGKRGRGLK